MSTHRVQHLGAMDNKDNPLGGSVLRQLPVLRDHHWHHRPLRLRPSSRCLSSHNGALAALRWVPMFSRGIHTMEGAVHSIQVALAVLGWVRRKVKVRSVGSRVRVGQECHQTLGRCLLSLTCVQEVSYPGPAKAGQQLQCQA